MQAEKTLIYSHDIILPLIPPNHLKFCHLFQYIINMLYYYYNIIIFLSYFSCSWILTFLSLFSFPGRESPSDVLFQPAGMKSVSSTQDSSSISSHPKLPEAQDIKSSAKPSSPWAQDLQSSGDESGDSEIEQVAEEPDSPIYDLTSKTPPAKGGFSQASNPFEQTSYTSATDKASNPFDKPQTNKVSASNPFDLSGGSKGGFGQSSNPPLYSLLREEREAELDSDLLIESASEESPKREQEYSAPKPPEISSLPWPQTSRLLSPLRLPALLPLPSPTPQLAPWEKQRKKKRRKKRKSYLLRSPSRNQRTAGPPNPGLQ